MIDRSGIEATAARFGIPDTQIIRDHVISHVLAAIAGWPDCVRLTFFGGTAYRWTPTAGLMTRFGRTSTSGVTTINGTACSSSVLPGGQVSPSVVVDPSHS
jgi:hypothetical protein